MASAAAAGLIPSITSTTQTSSKSKKDKKKKKDRDRNEVVSPDGSNSMA